MTHGPGVATPAVGVDVVPVDRVAGLLASEPAAAARIFTASELAYSGAKRHRTQHLAARFAAKEAVLKALGTGVGARMRWTDVEVVTHPTGRPTARLHGEAAACARRRGLAHVAISLSHTRDVAVATAIATRHTES